MSLKRKEPDTGFEGHDAAKRPLVQQVIAKAPVVQITTRPAASSSAAADGGGGLGPSLPSSAAIGPSLPPSAIPTAIDASNAAPYPVGYMPRARAASGAPRGAPIVSGASASASAGPAPSPIPARAAPLPATSTGISVLQSIASRSKAPTPEPAVKKHVRTAAGVVWEDPTLSAWNDDDYRIFVGDLGNECTDEMLKQAFVKYPSFQRARVVRDKKSFKTKGYGFVSFSDATDYMKAMKEMQGKYIGNRPVKLRKSRWQDREAD